MKNGWNLKFAGIAGAGILAVGIGMFIMDNVNKNEDVILTGNEQDDVMQTEERENNVKQTKDGENPFRQAGDGKKHGIQADNEQDNEIGNDKVKVNSGQKPDEEGDSEKETETDEEGNSKKPEQDEEESDGDDSEETEAFPETHRFEYDSLGRLTIAEYEDYIVKYEYDANENILKTEITGK